ncbi:MAG: YegP family protein [Catenulispora sp.]
MAGKFEVYKDQGSKFRFRLKAANGQIIAASEAYESKAALLSGIESIRSHAATAALVDMTEAPTPGPAPAVKR